MKMALQLAGKDFRIYFRDPIGLLLGFLLPIVLVTIFGFIMGAAWGGSGPMPRVTLYVADEDNSPASKSFISQLRQSDMLRVRPRLEEPPFDRARISQLVDDGEASHALVIQKGFSTNNNQADESLLLIRDPGRGMEDQMVQISMLQALFASRKSNWWIDSLASQFDQAGMEGSELELFRTGSTMMGEVIDRFREPTSSEEEVASDANGTLPGETTDLSDAAQQNTMSWMTRLLPLETEDRRPPARPKQATYQMAQAVAGMSVMMLMFGLTSCGRTLLQQREAGTLARLLTLGVSRHSILLGTAIFVAGVGIMQMAVLFVYGELIFKVGLFRDPLTLTALTLIWVLTATSFGMLIATSAKSEKQADMLATILIISMAALGGCWFPLQMLDLPTPLELVSKSTVTYWAMSGFQTMLWNGGGLLHSKILWAIGVQGIYLLIMAIASHYFFRRNYLRG